MGDADEYDYIALGQKAIRFQGVLLRDHHIFLVLTGHVHLIEALELANCFQVRLGVLGKLLAIRIDCCTSLELFRVWVNQVDASVLIQSLQADD